MNCQLTRPDEPTRSPPRHCMRFGKTSQGDDSLWQLRGEPRSVASRCQARVDLVADQPQIVLLSERRDRCQLRFVEYHATRIVRGCPDDGARVLGNQAGEGSQIGSEITARGCSNHPRTRRLERGRICWIHWVERDDLVAHPGNTHRRHEQRVLCSGQIHDVVGIGTLAGALCVCCGYRLAYRASPGSGAVVRVARLQPFDSLGNDSRRRIEVRVADTEDDHVFAAVAGSQSRVVCQPCISTFSADALYQRRKLHLLVVMRLRARGSSCIFEHK